MISVKVWIGSWKQYNEGKLVGDWFDLEDYSNYDKLEKAVRKAGVEGEELACFDVEIDTDLCDEAYDYIKEFLGFDGSIEPTPEEVFNAYEYLKDWDDAGDLLSAAYLMSMGYHDPDDIESYLPDVVYYEDWDDAIDAILESWEINDSDPVYGYIDFEKLEHDLISDGYYEFCDYVFAPADF